MTSFTAADLKLGGRLITACDAIGAGHLHKASAIFSEIAEDLAQEALSTTGLLAPDEDDWSAPMPVAAPVPGPALKVTAQDLQMCARNVHAYAAPDRNGWRTCSMCGYVNVAPPEQ